MLSLESTTEAEVVRPFDRRMRSTAGADGRYVLEPKFDGLSIEVVYQDGQFVSASTRGDGERGEDVTANVRAIRAVPLRLREAAVVPPRLLAVRGEGLMRRVDLAALNEQLLRTALRQSQERSSWIRPATRSQRHGTAATGRLLLRRPCHLRPRARDPRV